MNVADAKGLSFECRPGCGFCCTASPLVHPREAPALGALVVRMDDGTLRIPMKENACGALGGDRGCGIYAERPVVCRLYPYQVHAGRRLQAVVSLACPGVGQAGENAELGALRAAELALAQPEAEATAARAKATFAEFDRRMKEWGVAATADKLRSAFAPHVARLALAANLPAYFAGLEAGDLVLGKDGARDVAALFEAEADADLADLYRDGAGDAFDEPDTVVWVEPDLSWTRVLARDGRVTLLRSGGAASSTPRKAHLDPEALPAAWTEDATKVVEAYLTRLLGRDHTEGAALWLVDASQYQATPAAAYGRVLGEASLQVALRAALLAADDGLDTVDEAHARRGVAAYETSYHSLPTLGAIL